MASHLATHPGVDFPAASQVVPEVRIGDFGLDVVGWVREGLLDEVSPSVWNGEHKRVDPQMGYLLEACKQKHCRLIVNMLPRQYRTDEYLAKARQFLAGGAEGAAISGAGVEVTNKISFLVRSYIDTTTGAGIGAGTGAPALAGRVGFRKSTTMAVGVCRTSYRAGPRRSATTRTVGAGSV